MTICVEQFAHLVEPASASSRQCRLKPQRFARAVQRRQRWTAERVSRWCDESLAAEAEPQMFRHGAHHPPRWKPHLAHKQTDIVIIENFLLENFSLSFTCFGSASDELKQLARTTDGPICRYMNNVGCSNEQRWLFHNDEVISSVCLSSLKCSLDFLREVGERQFIWLLSRGLKVALFHWRNNDRIHQSGNEDHLLQLGISFLHEHSIDSKFRSINAGCVWYLRYLQVAMDIVQIWMLLWMYPAQ